MLNLDGHISLRCFLVVGELYLLNLQIFLTFTDIFGFVSQLNTHKQMCDLALQVMVHWICAVLLLIFIILKLVPNQLCDTLLETKNAYPSAFY